MSHLFDFVDKMRAILLSFSSPINIVICRLDLDSLVAAFAMKYYIDCISGKSKTMRIFYNGKIQDSLLKNICNHFSLLDCVSLTNIINFDGVGNNIFIDFIGHTSTTLFPKIDKTSVFLGNLDRGSMVRHNVQCVTLSSLHISVSAIIFNIFSLSNLFKKMNEELEKMIFMIIIAIHHDIRFNKSTSSQNMNVYGRAINHIGIARFHDMYEGLTQIIIDDLSA